jgi:uncharacterized protein involved in exopolysaccharide biosynthesis
MFGIVKQLRRIADAAEAPDATGTMVELSDFMTKTIANNKAVNEGLAEHYARVQAHEREVKEAMGAWHTALGDLRARITALEAHIEGEGWRS